MGSLSCWQIKLCFNFRTGLFNLVSVCGALCFNINLHHNVQVRRDFWYNWFEGNIIYSLFIRLNISDSESSSLIRLDCYITIFCGIILLVARKGRSMLLLVDKIYWCFWPGMMMELEQSVLLPVLVEGGEWRYIV